ncbi:MAG: hypothetical protein ACOC5S_02585 [Acidobacteriota bacterium]
MKKAFKVLGMVALIFCFSNMLSAQIQRPRKPFKIELGLNFGSTLGYSMTESFYNDSLNTYWIDVNESGEIVPELSHPLSIGGNINLITNMGIGVQLALDYNLSSDITGFGSYYVTGYDWWGDINEGFEVDNRGTVKLMVLSLNFIYKYQGGRLCPWFSGGASYFNGNLDADSMVGFGFEDDYGDFDYISFPVYAYEDLSGIGFNVGGGLDIQFAPNTAFTIEARYFILKEHVINWFTEVSGQFESYIWGITYTVDPAVGDYLDGVIEPFEFNPSFPKIAAGIKFSF